MDGFRPCSDRALLYACCVDRPALHLEVYECERTPGGTRDRPTGPEVEQTLVTRAMHHPFFDSRSDGTRKMRTLLTVRDKSIPARSHEHAIVLRAGVRERQHATDGDRVHGRDPPNLRHATAPAPQVLHDDPELPDGEGQACEHHELHEVAAL